MNELDVLKRNAGINEDPGGHDINLLQAVAKQMAKDVADGDYTAIDDLLKNVPEEELKGFLSEIDESKNINEDSKMIKVKVINSGYRTDMGMKDAEIISQELDFRGMPILKVRIEDVNMGDPVVADFKDGGWVVDMD